ncbi:hypothetical protein CEB3_c13220 [Peptococcaceae bacterium CEB3]|nr:hypothetical protein CEB3_c13220 [Peptococcaceae bacterium CEB3]
MREEGKYDGNTPPISAMALLSCLRNTFPSGVAVISAKHCQAGLSSHEEIVKLRDRENRGVRP